MKRRQAMKTAEDAAADGDAEASIRVRGKPADHTVFGGLYHTADQTHLDRMMTEPNTTLYCLTSDVDWASEYCIRDFLQLASQFAIRPTVFATHKSAALQECEAQQAIQVGVHPNFDQGSTHCTKNGSYLDVINHVFELYPHAETFRSHRFFDNTPIALAMARRNIRYDSNLCLYLQPNIAALRHASGILRFPVFWEDDVHWLNNPDDWNVDNYLPAFLTPGLKILNVHPFMIATNCPSHDCYVQTKNYIATLDESSAERLRYSGRGCRTFLLALLKQLTAMGARFCTLKELHAMAIDEGTGLPKGANT